MPTQFDTLISLAQLRCDSAARELAGMTGQARDAEHKYTALSTYRDEYLVRLDEMVRHGAAAPVLQNFRAFVGKLDEAVNIQRTEVTRWHRATDAARTAWQREQRQLRSYSTVQERRNDARLRYAVKAEQKQQDELASRSFFFGAPRFALAR